MSKIYYMAEQLLKDAFIAAKTADLKGASNQALVRELGALINRFFPSVSNRDFVSENQTLGIPTVQTSTGNKYQRFSPNPTAPIAPKALEQEVTSGQQEVVANSEPEVDMAEVSRMAVSVILDTYGYDEVLVWSKKYGFDNENQVEADQSDAIKQKHMRAFTKKFLTQLTTALKTANA